MNCLLKSEISNSLKSICVAIMATHNYSIIFFRNYYSVTTSKGADSFLNIGVGF